MLETVDLTLRLDRDAYVRELTRRQIQLRELGYQVYLQKRPGGDRSSKDGMRLAKAARSSGSPKSSIRAAMSSIRSARRRARTRRAITFTASGGGCRSAGRSPFSTAPGTAACWWSAWKDLPKRGRMEARLQGDQFLRAAAARFRHDPGEVLDPHLARGAVAALRGTQGDRLQSLEADGRRLAQSRQVGAPMSEAVEEMLVKTSTRRRRGAWWKATTSIGRE